MAEGASPHISNLGSSSVGSLVRSLLLSALPTPAVPLKTGQNSFERNSEQNALGNKRQHSSS